MPLITTIHESLPYIDPEPTPLERLAAESLIATERAVIPDDPHHGLLTPLTTPTFPPATTALLTTYSQTPRPPLRAIDLTRYEAPDAPPISGSTSEQHAALSSALARAYTSATYLSSRRAHLALLDSSGKNAWLVGNFQLEGELAALEKELAERKAEIDVLTAGRQRAQGEVEGEMHGLEETWKKGVGRVLETEVAAEELRRRILEVRREAA